MPAAQLVPRICARPDRARSAQTRQDSRTANPAVHRYRSARADPDAARIGNAVRWDVRASARLAVRASRLACGKLSPHDYESKDHFQGLYGEPRTAGRGPRVDQRQESRLHPPPFLRSQSFTPRWNRMRKLRCWDVGMLGRLVPVTLLLASAVLADSRTYQIAPGSKNVVEFHAEDTYDSFDGRTNKVTGAITADPSHPSAATVEVSVDMASLDTANSLRNREMRELYLDTKEHPTAKFKSVSVIAPDAIGPNQPADIKVTGDFTLHGVSRRMTIPVRVVLIPDGRVHATSTFTVHMPDFGISVPKNILVTVDDNVPVRLDLWAVAK